MHGYSGDQYNLRILRDLMAGLSRREAGTPACGEHMGEAADSFKCPVGRLSFFIEHLHNDVGIYHKVIPNTLSKAKTLLLFFPGIHPA